MYKNCQESLAALKQMRENVQNKLIEVFEEAGILIPAPTEKKSDHRITR